MEKVYSPADIEQRLYQRWEAAGYFAPRPGQRSYCIVIPPPNVTGTLHMGHAFQDTIMDALIRQHRMRGEQTLWQGGTDHAGTSTPRGSGVPTCRVTPSSNASGPGSSSQAAPSRSSCAASAPRWTGHASA